MDVFSAVLKKTDSNSDVMKLLDKKTEQRNTWECNECQLNKDILCVIAERYQCERRYDLLGGKLYSSFCD